MATIESRRPRRALGSARARYELQESLPTWGAAQSVLFELWRIHLEHTLCWRRLNLRQEDRLLEKAGDVLADVAAAPERALREIIESNGDIEAWFVGRLWPFRAPRWQRLRWQYTRRP
jgi:hypothetical protein